MVLTETCSSLQLYGIMDTVLHIFERSTVLRGGKGGIPTILAHYKLCKNTHLNHHLSDNNGPNFSKPSTNWLLVGNLIYKVLCTDFWHYLHLKKLFSDTFSQLLSLTRFFFCSNVNLESKKNWENAFSSKLLASFFIKKGGLLFPILKSSHNIWTLEKNPLYS